MGGSSQNTGIWTVYSGARVSRKVDELKKGSTLQTQSPLVTYLTALKIQRLLKLIYSFMSSDNIIIL